MSSARIVVVALLGGVLTPTVAHAQSWNTNSTSTWETSGNWSGAGGIPDTQDELATFNQSNGQDGNCSVTTDYAIGGITMANDYDGALLINSAITLTDAGTQTGSLNWVDTSIAGSGGFSLRIGASGSLTIHGNANVNVEPVTTPLQNLGTITFAGTAPATWQARESAAVPNWGAVVVDRTDTLSLGSAITCSSLTVNTGTLSVNTRTLTITGDLVIDGASALITVGAGSIVVQGNLTIRNGGQLQIDEGTVTVTGTITVEQGSAAIVGATTGGTISSGGLLTIGDASGVADSTLGVGRGTANTAGGLLVQTDGDVTFVAATAAKIRFNHAAATTRSLTAPTTVSFPALQLDAGNATTSVLTFAQGVTATGLSLTQGTLDLNGQVATVTGDVTVTANGRTTATTAGSGLTFTGAAATQTWSDSTTLPGQNFGTVTVDKSSGQVALGGNGVSCNQLSFNTGTLDLTGRQLSLVGTGVDSPIDGLGGGNQVVDSSGSTSTIRFAGAPSGPTVVVPTSTDVTYEALVFDGPASNTSYTLSGAISATSLSVTQGAVSLGGAQLLLTGDATITANGSVTAGAGGELECNNVEVDGTFNGAGGTFDVNGVLDTTSSGTITMGDGTFECGDDARFTNAAFTSTGLFLFNRAAGTQQDLVITGDDTFGTVQVAESSTNGVVVSSGTGAAITWTVAGLTVTSGKLLLSNTAGQAVSLVVNGATTVGAGGTASSFTMGGSNATTLDFNGTFTVGANGTIVQGAGAGVTFSGDVDLSLMTATNYQTPGDVTLDEASGTDQTIALPSGTLVWDDLIINRSAASDRIPVTGTGTLQTRSITVTSGVLAFDTSVTVPNGPVVVGLAIAGNGRVECTSATARTFVFRAADATNCVTIADGGDFVFSGAGHSLTFQSGRTVDVNGTAATVFTIDGGPGTATLQDEANDTTLWVIDVDAAVTFSVLSASIIDSDANGTAAPLVAANSTLDADTVDWIRGRIWRGTSADWSAGANWTGGAAPSSTEVAVFDAGSNGVNQPTTGIASLPTPGQIGGLIAYGGYTGTITLDASLTLNGSLSFDAAGGAQVAFSTFNLEVAGNVTLSNLGGAFGSGSGRLVMDKAGAPSPVLSIPASTTLGVGFQVGDTGTNTSITLPQPLTVTGATSVVSGSTLVLSGNTLTANGGLTVAGTLNASGGTDGQTAVDATDLTVSGTYTEGLEDTRVSGDVSVTGTWTNDTSGELVFDGGALVGSPQSWASTGVGEVRLASVTNGYVQLSGAAAALSVVVETSDSLDTGSSQLTVTNTLDVNAGGFLVGGGTAATAVSAGALTLAGTYTENTGDLRVSGAVSVSGTWTNHPTGRLIFTGTGTQNWTGSGGGASGVGEVLISASATPLSVTLQSAVTVTTLLSAGVDNNLALNGQTITVLGNGGTTNPPLDLAEANDLTGTGTVLFSTPGSSDTSLDGLNYSSLQLTRSSGANPAVFRPAAGVAISVAVDLTVGAGASYTTADAAGTSAQQNLSVTGTTTLNGNITAAGPVSLTFIGAVTVNGGGSLTAGSGGVVAASFGSTATVNATGALNLNGGNAVNVTFARDVTLAASTVTHTAGTVTFDRGSNNTLTLTSGAGNAFAAVTVQNDTDLVLAGSLGVTNGLQVTGTGTTFTAQTGGAVSAVSLTVATGTFTAQGTATVTAGSLTVSGADGAAVTMNGGLLTVNGALTVTRGSVTVGAGGADLNGNVSFGATGTRALTLAGAVALSGDLDLGNASAFSQSGTLTFDGGAPLGNPDTQTVTITATAQTFGGAVVVNLTDDADAATADTLVVTGAAGTFTVSGAVTVTQGVLSVRRSSTFTGVTTVAGAGRLENRSVGSLTHTFSAAVTVQDGGEFRFGDTLAPGLTLTFKAGQTVTVGQTGAALFEVKGSAGTGAITMQSESAGNAWLIDAFSAGSVSVDSVTLRDSNNQSNVPPGPVIVLTANNSYDATPSTTQNWNFPAKVTSWTGMAFPDTNWTNAGNWSPGIPNRGDTVNFDQIVTTDSTMNIDFGVNGIAALTLSSQFTGTLTLNQPLRVTGATSIAAGSFMTLSGNLLTVDGGLTVSGTLNATGGNDTETVLDVTDLTVAGTGVFLDGNEDVLVSGNLNVAGTWTNDVDSDVVFDGAAVLATAQTWASAVSIGEVRIASGTDGFVRLSGAPSATSVTVDTGDTLELLGSQLTVSGLTTVTGTLLGGSAATSLRTGGLTITGTYTEGPGDTRVSGNLAVSGTWTNDPAGDLIFDGAATQTWNGSGLGANGVGEVVIAGNPTPTTVQLVTSDPSVISLRATVQNNILDLNGRTLTVFGNGVVDPPLDLFEANDLTANAGTVVLQRTAGSTTSVDALNYHHLQLTALAATAAYRPLDAAITTTGDFQVGAGASYTTADATATQRDLTVQGNTTITGALTAAGPVALAFGNGTTDTVSVTGTLTAGASGTVTATFAGPTTVGGTMNLTGPSDVNATFARDLTVTGTLSHTAGTVTVDAGGNTAVALSLNATTSFRALTVQGDTNATLTGPLTVANAFQVSGSGTTFALAGPANTVTVGSLQVTGADSTSFSMAGSSGLLTVSGALTVSRGTVTVGSGGADIEGSITFGASGTRALTLAGAVNLAGNLDGTGASAFTAPTTLLLDGNAQTLTLTAAVDTFNAVTVSQTGVNPTLAINGGGNTFTTTGALSVTNGAVTLGATTTTNVTTLGVTGGSLTTGTNTVTATGLITVGAAGALTVSGSGGVLQPRAGLNVAGAFSNSGILRFNGGTSTWTDTAPTASFGAVEVLTGATVTTGSSLVCGSLTQTGGALTVAAGHTLAATGAASHTTGGSLTIDATGVLEPRGGLTINTPLTFSNSGTVRFTTNVQTWNGNVVFGAVVVASSVSTTSNLTTTSLGCESSGQLTLGVGATQLTVRGNIDLASNGGGALVMTTGQTLRFEATSGAPTFSFDRGTELATNINNLETFLSGSATSLTLNVVRGVFVAGTLTIPANTTVDAQASLFRVGGATTIGGTASRLTLSASAQFDSRVDINSGGTLEAEANASFLGSSGGISVNIASGATFVNDVNPVTLIFQQGSTLNVVGTVNVQPNSGLTDLQSDTLGQQFIVEIGNSATQTFTSVRVRDSDGNAQDGTNQPSAGANATATGTKLSNVVDWDGLIAAEFAWTGNAGDGDWGNPANYTGPSAGVPFAGARLVFSTAGNTNPAPSNGTMSDLGEIEVNALYTPSNVASTIVFTSAQTLENGLVANSASASINLGAFTLTVNGNLQVQATPISGAGAVVALEGSAQSIDVTGPLISVPLRIGDGVDATTATLVRALQVPQLTVSATSGLVTSGFQVQVTGLSTVSGDLTASTSLYISGGSFDASGAGLVSFGSTGTLRMTGAGSTLTAGTGDQFGALQVQANVSQGGATVLDLDGGLTVSAGTFTLASGLNVAGAVNLIGGALTPGASSTVTFDGTGTRTLTHDANDSFRHVVVAVGSGNDLDVTDAGLAIAGDLTVTSGRLDLTALLGGNNTSAGGAVDVTGTLLSGPNVFTAGNGLTVNNLGTFTGGGNVTVNGAGGLSIASGGAFSAAGFLDVAGGLVADGTFGLTANGDVDGSVTGAGSITLAAVQLNVGGDWTFSGAQTPGASTVVLDKGAAPRALLGAASLRTFNVLSFQGAGGVELVGDVATTLVTHTAGQVSLVDSGNVGHTLRLTGANTNPLQVISASFVGSVGANLGVVEFQTSNANVTVPALAYGDLTIASTAAGTYSLGAAASVAGALSVSGTATTTLTYGGSLSVTGGVTVAAGNVLRATLGGTTLQAQSVSGAGTLDLQGLTLTVALTGGGTPFTVTTVSNLAATATVNYQAACTVRSLTYGHLLLSGNVGTYTLPASLVVQGNATWTGATSAAATTLRFTGSSTSNFNCQAPLALSRLEVAKDIGVIVNLQGAALSTRQIATLVVEQGNLDVQASTTFSGTPTPNTIGQVGDPIANAQFFVQSPGVIVTMGNTTLHTNMLLGQGQLGVQAIFTANTTLTLQGNANLNFSGNAADKLEIRSSSGTLGQQASIVAVGPNFTVSATNVDVQNNDCQGVPATASKPDPGITATDSNDSGAADGWIFVGGGNIRGVRATGIGDGTGRLTKVQVLYDGGDPLNAATVGNAHVGYQLEQLGPSGTPVVTVAGTSAAIVNTPSGQLLEVSFGSGLGKTDTIDVRVRYTPPASNRLTNTLGRPASVSFALPVTDGAEPVLIGTSFQDVDGNGAADRGVFFFSEEVGFSARRGVSVSGSDPATSTATLGANSLLTLQIAGETLPAIDLAAAGLRPTGALIADRIQTVVRSYLAAPPPGHDPLVRPAILNFECQFVEGRYVLRAGVPLAYDPLGDSYTQAYALSSVVVITGGANDASAQLRLGAVNGGVETPGGGDARQGMLWSATLPDPDNVPASPTLLLGVNGEDPLVPVSLADASIEVLAAAIEAGVRTGVEPQHSSNTDAYGQLVVVPDRARSRLIIISGAEGEGSSVSVDTTIGLGVVFDTGAGGVEQAGRANTDTQLDDLNVFSATGRNLLLGRDASQVVCSGSTITVEFTNRVGDGTAAPRFVWTDDGDLGFLADAAPVQNRVSSTISNTPGGALLLVGGDTDGDRQLDSQAPGAGVLDVSQSVPPLGATGTSMSLGWSFVEFIDPTTLLPDPAVTAVTIGLTGTSSTRPTFSARRAGTYRFRLQAQVLDASGAPAPTPFTDAQGVAVFFVDYVVAEANPVADAGADQFVIGTVASVDASASYDPNLEPPAATTLGFQWSAIDQNGTAVAASAFSDPLLVAPDPTQIAAPDFTAPAPGIYTLTVTVYKTADTTKRDADTVQLTFTDQNDLLPTADAGDDIVRRVGELVTLDGRRSRDPEEEPLVYRWTFVSGPAAVNLAADTTNRPTYTPALAGAYVFELVVDDGVYSSPPDQVTVQVVDDLAAQPRRAPAAVARVSDARRGVFLGASPSTNWERNVEVVLADGSRVRPVAVDLAANASDDPAASTIKDTVRVDVFDGALTRVGSVYVRVDPALSANPVELLNLGAEARVLDYGVAGEPFVLDGTRSQDDGSIRTFSWTQVGGPSVFTTQTGSLVTVVPITGTYTFELTVTDATNLSSRAQRVTIPVVPAAGTTGPPVARVDAGSGATEVAGAGTPWSPLACTGQANGSITLSAAASTSNNGAPIAAYAWQQVAGPTAILSGATTSTLSVTGKAPGTYRFLVTVSDTDGVSSSAEVWLTLVAAGQDPPVARIDGAASRVVALGGAGVGQVSLQGSSSTGEEPLAYEWGQTEGVPIVIDDDGEPSALIVLDQPGTYVFTLRVTDVNGVTSAPASVAVWAVAQGDAALASGASSSKSSGGCAVSTTPRAGQGASTLLLAALALSLALLRRRAS